MMDPLHASPVVLALAIFVARILDVSLGTLRTILVFRSYRVFASTLGFVEVVIWVIAASQVLQDLNRWYLVVAYAGGFATGNAVGMWLESKLAVGTELVRAISESREVRLAQRLREANYSVIELAGTDGRVPVEVLLINERRRKIPGLLRTIEAIDPDAVCTISDIRHHVPRPVAPSGWRSFIRQSKRK